MRHKLILNRTILIFRFNFSICRNLKPLQKAASETLRILSLLALWRVLVLNETAAKLANAASRVATFGLRPKAPGQAHAFLKFRQNKSTKGEDLR